MRLILFLFLLPFFGPTDAGQEVVEKTRVFVTGPDLPVVSSSVLAAEAWLRAHVLSRYPSTNVSTIVVGDGVRCSKLHEQQRSLVLPSAKNLQYSLVRWGLAEEIKVSVVAFSSRCLKRTLQSLRVPSFRESPKAPAFGFSPAPGSSFSFVPEASPPEIPDLPSPPAPPSVVSHPPTPPPEIPNLPSPPPPPLVILEPPTPPPCSATPVAAPPPENGQKEGLWCVAKPAVPAEKLQEAMDFACGEGGADCEEIRPNGRCYFPDNVVAHASYAFNSYWQRWKQSGGSCSFDGTAILINSDPSFLQCHFELR